MIEDRTGSNRLRQRDIFVLRAFVCARTMTSSSHFSCGLSSLVLLASFHSARWRKAHASVKADCDRETISFENSTIWA
jgi:hypothetical protein